MEESERTDLLRRLVGYLMEERRETGGWMPAQPPRGGSTTEELWLTFRSLVNTREPLSASPTFLEAQDALLQGMIADKGITTIGKTEASPADLRIHLWRGDITTLAADAIVNAANSGMTGCWAPLHYCIDNAIHTFAGVQLRKECARLMEQQGHPEPTRMQKLPRHTTCPRIMSCIPWGPSPTEGLPISIASSLPNATAPALMLPPRRMTPASPSAVSARACSAFPKKKLPPSP